MDFQNPSLVRCLLSLGANVNSFNYGGFTPYHLTYGRQSEEIRCELYKKTAQELRELPDSESDESDMEEVDASEDEVCTVCVNPPISKNRFGRRLPDLSTFPPLQLYDDIKFGK